MVSNASGMRSGIPTQEKTPNNGSVVIITHGIRQKIGTKTINIMGKSDNATIPKNATTGMVSNASGMRSGLPVKGKCNHQGRDASTKIGAMANSGTAGRSSSKAAIKGTAKIATIGSDASRSGQCTGVPSSERDNHQSVCGVFVSKSSVMVGTAAFVETIGKDDCTSWRT